MSLLPEPKSTDELVNQRVATLLLADFVTTGLRSLLTIEACLRSLGGFRG